MLNKIVKICVYAIVFLTPLFFLPFSVEAMEFNKSYLLLFLVSLAFICWLAKMIFKDKQVKFQRTPLDLPILVFLFLMTLASFFSVDKVSSIVGSYGRFWPNLVGVLSLGLFYFLVTNNVQFKEFREVEPPNSKKEVRPQSINYSSLIKVFLWSSFFTTITAYFSILGLWQIISDKLLVISERLALPAVMLSRIFNPTSGSLQGLTIFLAITIVLIVCSFACREFSKKGKLFLGILLALETGILVILDFSQAWLIITISLGLFLGFALWKRLFKENVNHLTLPILLFIISICFLAVNPVQDLLPAENTLNNIPQEVLLSQGVSWQTGASALLSRPILGTGLGTFGYSFARYKPESFMKSDFWSLRFDRAGSHIAELFGTIGVLGMLSYLFLIAWFIIISWFILEAKSKCQNPKSQSSPKSQIPIMVCFIALLVSQFFYYQNITLAFSFWLFLGLGVLSWQKPVKEKIWKFNDFPEIGLVFNCCFWVLLIAGLVFYFVAGKFYLADTYYRKQLTTAGDNLQYLEKTVKWADYRTSYHTALAGGYLNLINQEFLKPTNEIDQNFLAQKTMQAIDQGQRATQLSPNRVQVWETLGIVYRDVRGLAEGASDWAVKSFEKALELEPLNPAIYAELGKLKIDEGKNEEGRQFFGRAIAVRGEYWEAELQSALLDEREGETEKATQKLEDLKSRNPFSTEIHFQLGRMYYNGQEIEKAISEFQQVLILFPNHSNARYSLALAYEKQGKISMALEQLEQVLLLNPGNAEVIGKIAELSE